MKINTPAFRATAALIGFAAFAFAPAAKAQAIPRMGVVQAPVGGFHAVDATASGSASVAAASMMPEISSWETVFAAPSIGIGAAMPASAAAPAALPAASFAASSAPEGEGLPMSAGSAARSPVAAPRTAAISGVHARAEGRIAELVSFFSSRKDADLAPSKSALIVGEPGTGRTPLFARLMARMPSAAVKTAGLGALVVSQAHPAWAAQASHPSMSDPVLIPLYMMAGALAAFMLWAIKGFVDSALEVAAIDSVLFADTKRRKKELGID